MGQTERRLIVDKAAEQEMLVAADWYEDRQPGVGRDFLDAVDVTFRLVQSLPGVGSASRWEEDVRNISLEGFPFSVVYRELEDAVYVIAVAHDKRRPGYWRSR